MKKKDKIIALLEAIAEEVGVDVGEVYSNQDPLGSTVQSHPPGPGTGGDDDD